MNGEHREIAPASVRGASGPSPAKRAAIAAAKASIVLFARAVTAARGIFTGTAPDATQQIYFANHASHADFVLVWTVLPPDLRAITRPVAAAEYWTASAVRSFIGREVFNAVLIERDPAQSAAKAMTVMLDALEGGDSLIIFPEGTRNATDERLLPLKSGLYHLARARPELDLTPVWIENLNRVMPKGRLVPIPLICTVTFGPSLRIQSGENRQGFLQRARDAMLALAPNKD